MIYFGQYVFSGILIGLLYAMVAMGLTIVWRSGRILNLAQGELLTFGGFLILLFLVDLSLPWGLGLIAAFAAVGLIGYVIQRGIYHQMVGQPMFTLVMMTIGLLILFRGLTIICFGAEPRLYPAIFPTEPILLGPFIFDAALLWGGIISMVILFTLGWFFGRTRFGLRVSATAEDHQVAQSLGISINQALVISWVLAAVVASLGSIFYLNGKVISNMSGMIGFKALPVAMLAGFESMGGLIPAGIIVGVCEGLARGYLDPLLGTGLGEVMPYIIMVIVILVRPSGLFGWKIIERL